MKCAFDFRNDYPQVEVRFVFQARRADTSVMVVLCRPFRPEINGQSATGASRHRLGFCQPSGLTTQPSRSPRRRHHLSANKTLTTFFTGNGYIGCKTFDRSRGSFHTSSMTCKPSALPNSISGPLTSPYTATRCHPNLKKIGRRRNLGVAILRFAEYAER